MPCHKSFNAKKNNAIALGRSQASALCQTCCSSNLAQKLGLEDVLALLILLACLERLIVLPTHRLLALLAIYVPYDVPARRHVALSWLTLCGVDNAVEEVGFAVLAAEVTADYVVMVGEVGLAVLAAIDFVGVKVDVVCQPHGDGRLQHFKQLRIAGKLSEVWELLSSYFGDLGGLGKHELAS